MKLGIIKEGKIPPDERVPFSPGQLAELQLKYPQLEITVQSSKVRRFKDEDYSNAGIQVSDNVDHCDVLMGVKEVPKPDLIPNKTYFFFSHTIKKQPYNRELLQAILAKNIQLIDYECLTDENGTRLLGFGRYAGIVGAYNTLKAFGQKYGLYDLKAAHLCEDMDELHRELSKLQFTEEIFPKIVLTGAGRVAHGALEILRKAGIEEVDPSSFLLQNFNQPVFTQLQVTDYVKRKDGQPAVAQEFFGNPEPYTSNFMPYAKSANVYIACHYWKSGSPFIFTRNDAKSADFNIELVGDISCDIDGPVASTLRPSTIANPLYAYDPISEKEVAFNTEGAIDVMAVDNLPCELPKDASAGFGAEFIENILPAFFNHDSNGILQRASITKNGSLTEDFRYLTKYAEGHE
ncbi:MAG: alanine dehydrogenase [Flavobacteriales bacterium]|nr:alanine dehydrogenase [Flavobacteriales bacterium]